jgi:hypothetical protein
VQNPIHHKDIKVLYNRLKSSAKSRNIHFDLTLPELNNLTFPVTCPVLNIPLFHNTGSSKDNSVSFDRIDSTQGYTIDNIIVISNRANKLKSDATVKELKLLAEFYSI